MRILGARRCNPASGFEAVIQPADSKQPQDYDWTSRSLSPSLVLLLEESSMTCSPREGRNWLRLWRIDSDLRLKAVKALDNSKLKIQVEVPDLSDFGIVQGISGISRIVPRAVETEWAGPDLTHVAGIEAVCQRSVLGDSDSWC